MVINRRQILIIKYCPECSGRPYTQHLDTVNCPICGAVLASEFVNDDELNNRSQLPDKTPASNTSFNDADAFFFGNEEFDGNTSNDNSNLFGDPFPDNKDIKPFNSSPPSAEVQPAATLQPPIISKSNGKNTSMEKVIRGKVASYSSTGKEDGSYRRLFLPKLFDALIYHQRLEDVLHRFTVRVDSGSDTMGFGNYVDVPVNVHGTIAGGMQITDNCEVEVKGKYKNHVLMAQSIDIINNGYKSRVKFQHSIKAIFYSILFLIAAAVTVYFAASSNGNFLNELKYFMITWAIIAVITLVLYIIISFSKIGLLARFASGRPKQFPIIGILMLSFIATIIFLKCLGGVAGLGSLFSNLLIALLPLIILIAGIIILLKIIIK